MEKHSFCFPEEPFFLSNCDCRMFYLQVWACAQLGKGKEVVIPVCGSVAAQQCGCTIKEEQLHLTSDRRLLFLLNFVFLEKKHIGRSEWPGIWVEEIGAFVICQLQIGAMQAVLSIAIIHNCWEQSLGSHRGDRDVPGFLYASLRSKLDFIIVLFKRNVFLNIMVCFFFSTVDMSWGYSQGTMPRASVTRSCSLFLLTYPIPFCALTLNWCVGCDSVDWKRNTGKLELDFTQQIVFR